MILCKFDFSDIQYILIIYFPPDFLPPKDSNPNFLIKVCPLYCGRAREQAQVEDRAPQILFFNAHFHLFVTGYWQCGGRPPWRKAQRPRRQVCARSSNLPRSIGASRHPRCRVEACLLPGGRSQQPRASGCLSHTYVHRVKQQHPCRQFDANPVYHVLWPTSQASPHPTPLVSTCFRVVPPSFVKPTAQQSVKLNTEARAVYQAWPGASRNTDVVRENQRRKVVTHRTPRSSSVVDASPQPYRSRPSQKAGAGKPEPHLRTIAWWK